MAATDVRAELSGLDRLDLGELRPTSRARRLFDAAWPKLLAVAIFILGWQLVVWSGWKDEFVIPSPFTVFKHMAENPGNLAEGSATTLRRGATGFAIAMVIGGAVGLAIARVKVLRAAVGSMITGLQTMPSIAWFPLAVILFKLTEAAILAVVVLGAAPSIANGILNGIDHVPPILVRAGRVLGARGFSAMRHVILPAALPSVIGGLKQGWAFAWRSLLAGELIVLIPGTRSLGQALDAARVNVDYVDLYAVMIVIFVIGVAIDALVFGAAERSVRRRYGLIDAAA